MEDWRYSSTHVNFGNIEDGGDGELHPLASWEWVGDRMGPRKVWMLWRRKSLALPGTEPRFSYPACSLSRYTELSRHTELYLCCHLKKGENQYYQSNTWHRRISKKWLSCIKNDRNAKYWRTDKADLRHQHLLPGDGDIHWLCSNAERIIYIRSAPRFC
jgi:hypothetical protein